MDTAYWSSWYLGGGCFLWFGIVILLFSSAGRWGHTHRLHRAYGLPRMTAETAGTASAA